MLAVPGLLPPLQRRNAGLGALPELERIVERLAGHDLVFAIGAPAFTYHVEGWGPHLPQGAQLVQITEDPQIAAWAPAGIARPDSTKAARGRARMPIDRLRRRMTNSLHTYEASCPERLRLIFVRTLANRKRNGPRRRNRRRRTPLLGSDVQLVHGGVAEHAGATARNASRSSP